MPQEEADFEQRLARFDSLVDRFALTLHQWRQTQEQDIAADPDDVKKRINVLEETVERETRALRQLHDEPLQQLKAHTTTLGDLCVAAAKSVNGLDQAESRLAAIEADLHLHLTDLSKNFQALVTDLRSAAPQVPAVPTTTTAWPLDRVVQVHGQLRRGMNDPDSRVPFAGDADPSRMSAPAEAERSTVRSQPAWWLTVVVLIVIATAAAAVIERRLDARLTDATTRAAAAEQQAAAATQSANRQIATAREEAGQQLAAAQRSAERAERLGAILTAPDLIRFPLSSSSTNERLTAQVLLSRTRGLVLSASRLPVAPSETTYQLWLWTNGQPVSAGAFVPDASGTATLITDGALKVSGAITNIAVTIEPSGGAAMPSGRTLLARLQ